MNDGAQQKVDAYLERLRIRLRPIRSREADDIVAELRAHIEEKATSVSVESILEGLGTPEQLASEYLTDELLARAEVSRSPSQVLRSVFHLATLGFAGFVVLMVTISGYTLGAISMLAGLMKLLHPHSAGLWLMQGSDDLEISVHLGFGSAPSVGREVLGVWLAPLGLVVGCGLLVATTRFAVWCIRRYRESRRLPGGRV